MIPAIFTKTHFMVVDGVEEFSKWLDLCLTGRWLSWTQWPWTPWGCTTAQRCDVNDVVLGLGVFVFVEAELVLMGSGNCNGMGDKRRKAMIHVSKPTGSH